MEGRGKTGRGGAGGKTQAGTKARYMPKPAKAVVESCAEIAGMVQDVTRRDGTGHGTAHDGTSRHGTAQNGVGWNGMPWDGMPKEDMPRDGMPGKKR